MGISADAVRRIFAHLESGSGDQFFAHVADDVDWTVEGTHPLAGRYRSKADFHAHTFARLNKILPGGTQLHVENVLIDDDWAVAELRSHAVARNGMRFDNRYCLGDALQGREDRRGQGHLDSALVQEAH